MAKDDKITSTHRGHQHCVAKGVPIREMMWEVEAALIEEKNRARNTIRQRGVMDDYRHAESTLQSKYIQEALTRIRPEFREVVVLRDIQQLT